MLIVLTFGLRNEIYNFTELCRSNQLKKFTFRSLTSNSLDALNDSIQARNL
jgi:hypothetical protein